MKRLCISIIILALGSTAYSKAFIDKDLLASIKQASLHATQTESMAVIIFFQSQPYLKSSLQYINNLPGVTVQPLHFMPALVVIIPKNEALVETISNLEGATQLSLTPPYAGGHFPVMGSLWNPTYGWGYLNVDKALKQRHSVIDGRLSINDAVKEYPVFLPVGGKVTLVHERRVGYHSNNTEWKLSHVSLELYDAKTHQLIAQDSSLIDTVHQVDNCRRKSSEKQCSKTVRSMNAIIRVKLLSPVVDGSQDEPFVIVFG